MSTQHNLQTKSYEDRFVLPVNFLLFFKFKVTDPLKFSFRSSATSRTIAHSTSETPWNCSLNLRGGAWRPSMGNLFNFLIKSIRLVTNHQFEITQIVFLLQK